jgi:hypothetical protein
MPGASAPLGADGAAEEVDVVDMGGDLKEDKDDEMSPAGNAQMVV